MSVEGDVVAPAAWQPAATCLHPTAVSGVTFDPLEERLWLTDTDGFVASYTYPDMGMYSRTRSCWVTNYDDATWAVTAFRGHGLRPQASASGISVATGANVRLYDRGGVLMADVPASALAGSGRPATGAATPAVLNVLPLDSFDPSGVQSSSRLVAAGTLPDIHLVDATRLWTAGGPGGGVLRNSAVAVAAGGSGYARGATVRSIVTLPVPHAVGALCVAEGRSLVAASLDGPSINVYDVLMRSPAPTARLTGHTGGTLSMDATRNLLIAVGASSPGESPTYPAPVRT